MDLVVVDAQNDFISGSLACKGASDAMEAILAYILSGRVRHVFYSADYHSKTNRSFKKNGGIWPVHCVAGEIGAKLWDGFAQAGVFQPKAKTIFLKGVRDDIEEYSAVAAKNIFGKKLVDMVEKEVVITGLASEYCVRETALDLLNAGKTVALYLPGVGYVAKDDHEKNISDLREKGIVILEA